VTEILVYTAMGGFWLLVGIISYRLGRDL